MAGFEPTAFRSQSGRATKLRHTPSGATRRVHARRQRGCRISRAAGRTTPGAPPPRSLERPGRAAWKRPPPPSARSPPERTTRRSKRARTASAGARAVSRRAAGPTSGGDSHPAQAPPWTRGPVARTDTHGVGTVVTPRERRRAAGPAQTLATGCARHLPQEGVVGANGWHGPRCSARAGVGGIATARAWPGGEDAQGVRRTRFPGTGVRTRRSRLRRRVTSATAPLRASVRPFRDARGRGRTEGVCDEGGRPGTMPSCRRSPDRGARCAGVAQW